MISIEAERENISQVNLAKCSMYFMSGAQCQTLSVAVHPYKILAEY